MSRVIAVVACGFTLTACTSSWMPSFELPSMPSMPSLSSLPSFSSSPAQQTVTLAVESDPPGAEARAAGGPSCRTPCSLKVTASEAVTVNVALNGYLPQSVPVRIMQSEDPRFGGAEDETLPSARLDPNPVFVELERAPPPPATKKKPAPPKRSPTAARSGPMTAAAPPPAAATTASAPAPAATAPWPMPR